MLTCCNSKQEKVVIPVPPKIAEPVRIIAIGRVERSKNYRNRQRSKWSASEKLYTHAGDTVKKGQLLVEFAHDYEDASYNKQLLKNAAQQAEIQNIQAQINSANIKAENLH